MAASIFITLILVGLVTVFAQERMSPLYPQPSLCPKFDALEPDLQGVKTQKTAGAEYEKTKLVMDRMLNMRSNSGIKTELQALEANTKVKADDDRSVYQKKISSNIMVPVKEECEEKEYLIYGVYHMGGYCWLPWPQSQNVRYTECIGNKRCNKISWPWWGNTRSYCMKTNYVVKYFHAYCPHLKRFKKIGRWLPQCCSCRTFRCGFRG